MHLLGGPTGHTQNRGPSTCLVFLGILVDTVRWELRLPDDKLQLLSALIQAWSHRSACQRRELESSWATCRTQQLLSNRVVHFSVTYSSSCQWLDSHMAHKRCQGQYSLVALLFEEVEWEVLLPTWRPIGSRVHRCIWVIWMRRLPADRALIQACLAM